MCRLVSGTLTRDKHQSYLSIVYMGQKEHLWPACLCHAASHFRLMQKLECFCSQLEKSHGGGSVMSSLCRTQTRAASYQGPPGEKHSAMFCKAQATMPPTGHKHADTHKDELSFAPVLSPDLDPIKLFFIQKKTFQKLYICSQSLNPGLS